MKNKQGSVLVFGGGELQLSIINECKELNRLTVVIDPNPKAPGHLVADRFEVVGPNDFEHTCSIVEKYTVEAVLTAATDKPLVMMARVAEKYGLSFFSERTAIISTDKFLMKEAFLENGIPCAKGRLIETIDESLAFPSILKPRDNSGSRGIVLCNSREEAEKALGNAFAFSAKKNILAEEYIEGREYSIEALHSGKKTSVLQMTEKLVTKPPYNVELGHIQPSGLDQRQKAEIESLIDDISDALGFENCASHTEIKINERGIFVIESSPRLGGDFITSRLVPLSTGINIERELIKIAIGDAPSIEFGEKRAAGVFYFNFVGESYVINEIPVFEDISEKLGIVEYSLDLRPGMKVPVIKNSLDRYGFIILAAENRDSLLELAETYSDEIRNQI